MRLTNQLIATLVVSIRHYQTMHSLSLIPTYITDVSSAINLKGTTNLEIEALVGHLLTEPNPDRGIMVGSRETLLLLVSVMHLVYSLETNQDIGYILDVVSELGISTPTLKESKDIFYRLCRGFKLQSIHRHILLDAFSNNRSLQMDDLFLPSLLPNKPFFYTYA